MLHVASFPMLSSCAPRGIRIGPKANIREKGMSSTEMANTKRFRVCDRRAHASAVATIDDAPGPYRHLEESEAQMEFTEECVSALMSSPNTDDLLISQVEFAEFFNGLTDGEAKGLMFHNLYWTVSLAWVVFLLNPHARTVLLRAVPW